MRSVTLVGGRTPRLYPGVQIVLAMVLLLTRASTAPGVHAASGKPAWTVHPEVWVRGGGVQVGAGLGTPATGRGLAVGAALGAAETVGSADGVGGGSEPTLAGAVAVALADVGAAVAEGLTEVGAAVAVGLADVGAAVGDAAAGVGPAGAGGMHPAMTSNARSAASPRPPGMRARRVKRCQLTPARDRAQGKGRRQACASTPGVQAR